ncbi:MAG: ABC transporter substrate-binding protein [Thermomicrobiales bacterium]|nr:ABC transporter substrate-binding protein [Thermomicrobiales bacterium]
MSGLLARRMDRRQVLAGAGGGALAALWETGRIRLAMAQTPPATMVDALAFDLATEPPTLDPATTYDVDGWSVVHSIYDALVQYGPDGALQPLLAESLTSPDPLTWEVKLREGVTFQNGEPFDAKSVAFSVQHITDPETKSQVAGNFAVIEAVEEIDPHRVRLKLTAPAPWLPAQMAAWLVMLPPVYAADPANDFANNPVGTGPYRFAGWDRGVEVRLEVNPDYFTNSPKGTPIARAVRYHWAPEATTRVSDLLSGASDLIRDVPADQLAPVESAAIVIAQSISGSAWVRIPTDVAPFDDVRVRQALNYAVDVDAIVQALLAGHGQRLANFFVPGGLGFDPELTPYPYDPGKAKALLTEAGYPDGFDTELAYTSTERMELVAAVAGQLTDVGVRAKLTPVEKATFNATWTDSSVAPLRYATWRPMFDPYTLLSLLVSNAGFLSRYDNPNAQAILDAAAIETDSGKRAAEYRELGQILRDEPAAIYLFDLTEFYGASHDLPPWTPRADDYLIPTVVSK